VVSLVEVTADDEMDITRRRNFMTTCPKSSRLPNPRLFEFRPHGYQTLAPDGIKNMVPSLISETCITDIPDDLFTLEPDGKTDFKVE
jgi:hypothetical protein